MKDENGEASWLLLRDRAQAQGRRIDTLENAMRAHAEAALQQQAAINTKFDTINEKVNDQGRDLSSIKTVLKLAGAGVVVASPIITTILLRVVS